MNAIEQILRKGTLKEKRTLFSFNKSCSDPVIVLKFNLWARYFFPKYFKSDDAVFHEEMNLNNLDLYRGDIEAFVNAAFRGAGKDMKTKLFIAFVILNDLDHFRKFFKVLSEDIKNSAQSVTDIYNILLSNGSGILIEGVEYRGPSVIEMYPETFARTEQKREERMTGFTTSTGVKILASTVMIDQRGANQEESRPDFIWFNDFETRLTLYSGVETRKIWFNMEEARTGLEKGGGCLYTCNYISEQGNVHKLIKEKLSVRKRIMITPIYDEKTMELTWPERYTWDDIEAMKHDDEDFYGERMCKPDASKDVYFDRAMLEKMEEDIRLPLKEIGGFRIYKEYVASHRYASGHDVAGGVGLDSSTSVFIDFSMGISEVCATYDSNTIGPEAFGDEIYSQANRYGGCLIAPENNKYDQAVLKAKLLGAQLYKMPPRLIKTTNTAAASVYGWTTHGVSKSTMLDALRNAINDGLIRIYDKKLLEELKGYTRNDLIEKVNDPRDTTRHFDLVIALAIAWQMKDHARVKPKTEGKSIWNQSKEVNIAE